MARFGVNPFGEPIWRCVFAPSVKYIVGGRFPDGFTGYRVRKLLPHVGSNWILQKWISAYELTRMTEFEYNAKERNLETGLFPTGPYPHRGVYEYCETLSCSPEDVNFDKLIAWIERGKYNRTQDNARALMNTLERKEKAEEQNRFDRMKELMPAFGIRAANIGGRVKKTKTAPLMRSANELGLPVRGPSVQQVNHATG